MHPYLPTTSPCLVLVSGLVVCHLSLDDYILSLFVDVINSNVGALVAPQ